jgi:secreted trypsin-like serine protease
MKSYKKRDYIKKSIVTSIVAIMLALVSSVSASAISNGEPVADPVTEFPMVVPVWTNGFTLCSGTLLSQRIVLTSAHCIIGRKILQVEIGASKLNTVSKYKVDAVWIHPGYEEVYHHNDLALLHLNMAVPVTQFAKLPESKQAILDKSFLFVGWGNVQEGVRTGDLHKLVLDNKTLLAKGLWPTAFDSTIMLGAGKRFADGVRYGSGCISDSGAPLFTVDGKTIIGVASMAMLPCGSPYPTTFTRLDYYLDDIKAGMRQVIKNVKWLRR